MRNLLDVPEKLNEGASQRASTHLTSRITHRNIKISLDESLLKIFNWWYPDVERTGKSDDLQTRLARTVSDDKKVPPEYSMSLLTSIISCFEKPILSNIKTEGQDTRLLKRQGEQTNPSWCQLIDEAVFSVEVHVQVLGAPETRLQEMDMVLGGEEWQCVKTISTRSSNHLCVGGWVSRHFVRKTFCQEDILSGPP